MVSRHRHGGHSALQAGCPVDKSFFTVENCDLVVGGGFRPEQGVSCAECLNQGSDPAQDAAEAASPSDGCADLKQGTPQSKVPHVSLGALLLRWQQSVHVCLHWDPAQHMIDAWLVHLLEGGQETVMITAAGGCLL